VSTTDQGAALQVEYYLNGLTWAQDAGARVRDEGQVFHIEAFIVLTPHHTISIEELEEVHVGLKRLDWKINDAVVVPVHTIPDMTRQMSTRPSWRTHPAWISFLDYFRATVVMEAEDPDGEFRVNEEDSLAGIIEDYEDACRQSREVLQRHEMEDRSGTTGWHLPLGCTRKTTAQAARSLVLKF
jgi:hypothetical protein